MPTNSISVLFDTSALITVLRSTDSLLNHFAGYKVFIPSIAVGELYYGAYKSGNPPKHEAQIRELVEISQVLYVNEHTGQLFGSIRRQLEIKSNRIPENDIWIAAVAIQYGLPLVTRDHHFNAVDELQVMMW